VVLGSPVLEAYGYTFVNHALPIEQKQTVSKCEMGRYAVVGAMLITQGLPAP